MSELRTRLLVFAAVFLVVAGVYWYSAAPTAAFWDCGELISAAFTMGVPHPPGTPLFVALGRIFSVLPMAKEIAFRVTLIPVLFGAFSCGLIYLLVFKLITSYVDPGRRHDRWLPHVAGVFGALACAFTYATPIIRHAAWVAWLPDPIEWYVRPFPKLSVFTFFPWAGFVFAGAFVGEWLGAARSPAEEWRLNRRLAAAGVLLIAAACGSTWLPSLYPAGYSEFWTSSPAYYFIKIGIMLILMGLIYVYVQRPLSAEPRNPAWSPMLEFGRSSLFVYWIHVELAYGIFSYPLHRRLPVQWTLVAFIVFSAMIYGATILKSRIVTNWKTRRLAAQTA